MIDFSGKVVLVTGGSRGIGAAIVETLAHAHASVVLHYGRSRVEAEALAARLGPDRCLAVQADLAEEASVPRLWREALAWRGRIDALVNNAGIAPTVRIDDDFDAWHRIWAEVLRVNLVAAADLCREAIPHFAERGGGIIVNVASRAAFRGDQPDMMHYAASKAGLVALTRSIARGYGARNITAYVVAPGFVLTEMAQQAVAEYGAQFIRKDIALPDMTGPQEVANVVAFLASGLARHATGSVVDVNGASYVR
ncbi:MAG TPA: SDR family NAD(P)-dependent oxidoreductase [Alphaproteobacteria bacterium]|nr:SDR family NAD(P)-dependent oxidoreductase [Alphaproteobacteria bacterium]